MKLKPHQIQRIIDTFIVEKSIGKTVKITKYAKNTVKKYLRMYGLMPCYYSSITHTGPPSLYHQSSKWTPEQQQWIKDLLNKVQIAYSQGANLIKAFDKKNVENDELTEKITRINIEKENEIKEKEKEIKEKEKLQDKVSELENTNGEIKKEYQTDLEAQKSNYVKNITELEQKHQSDLEELKKNVEQYVINLAHAHQQELDKQRNTLFAAMEEKRKQDAQKFETERSAYEEQKKSLKNEIQKLKGKANTSFWEGVGIGLLGGTAVGVLGTLGYQKYFNPRSKAPRPGIVDSKYIHPGCEVTPLLEKISIQPEEQNINSGMPPDINTAGVFNCSGAYPTTDGNNTGVEHTSCLNQQRCDIR